jgi:F-type H+-transporting ATPase subunit b
MIFNALFWVAIAFFAFVALIWWLGAGKALVSTLDAQIKDISDMLEKAKQTREEAENLLHAAENQKAQLQAEAKAIISAAQEEAFALKKEAQASLKHMMERHTALLEEKTKQIQSRAVTDIRALSAEQAITMAQALLEEIMDSSISEKLITQRLDALKHKLH